MVTFASCYATIKKIACDCSLLYSSDTSRFGYQLMTKMGWESGKGLGARESGQTSHIKASKRRNNLGKNKFFVNEKK